VCSCIFESGACIWDVSCVSIVWLVEYCFTSHQLIYGYVETADDNDDEIDRHPGLHFKDKGSFTSHTI